MEQYGPTTVGGRHKKSGNPLRIFVVLLVVAVIILAVIAFLALRPKEPEPKEDGPTFAPNATVGALPGKTEEEIEEMLNQKVSEKMVAFTINSIPVFEDGSAEGKLMLESPANNINNIEFVISRDDTGEVLYRSGLLKPNQYIEKDRLQTEEPLAKGTYPCTAEITLYDPETFEEKGKTQAAITITIRN